MPQGEASHRTRVPAQDPAGPELLRPDRHDNERPAPACLAGAGCFIVNSDTHLPTQGWPPALPKKRER